MKLDKTKFSDKYYNSKLIDPIIDKINNHDKDFHELKDIKFSYSIDVLLGENNDINYWYNALNQFINKFGNNFRMHAVNCILNYWVFNKTPIPLLTCETILPKNDKYIFTLDKSLVDEIKFNIYYMFPDRLTGDAFNDFNPKSYKKFLMFYIDKNGNDHNIDIFNNYHVFQKIKYNIYNGEIDLRLRPINIPCIKDKYKIENNVRDIKKFYIYCYQNDLFTYFNLEKLIGPKYKHFNKMFEIIKSKNQFSDLNYIYKLCELNT